MSITSFTKTLFPSNLGEAGMHDRYITVPKKADPTSFIGNPPKTFVCIDKTSGDTYNFPFSLAANGEYRLTQFGSYFDDKNAQSGDEIYIEKVISPGSIQFFIDLIKNGVARSYEPEILLPDEVNEESSETYTEGAKMSVLVNKYERNNEARTKCIEHYGASCASCGFDFEKVYGDMGKGFIHVHHIKPVSDIGESYEVDPIKDLIPVCPNCHAMIHKRNPPYTIKELVSFMK